MDLYIKFLQGIVIGIGAIAPGVSGGALAVMFGLYDKIIYVISNFTKDTIKKIKYFLPVGIGGIIGIIFFSRFMNFLFEYYELETLYLFVGLMIGSLPTVHQQANKKGYRKTYLITFLICLSITLLFTFLDTDGISIGYRNDHSISELIIYGAIIGIGTIIPGISASVILIYIGVYEFVLNAISYIEIPILLFLGIGFLISIILFSKLINFLFHKAYGHTNYGILGLTLGSIILIFPGIAFNRIYIKYSLILIAGFFTTYIFSKIGKKK